MGITTNGAGSFDDATLRSPTSRRPSLTLLSGPSRLSVFITAHTVRGGAATAYPPPDKSGGTETGTKLQFSSDLKEGGRHLLLSIVNVRVAQVFGAQLDFHQLVDALRLRKHTLDGGEA